MRCPSCTVDNPAGMGFCGHCGAEMLQRCAKCGFENPARFEFCGKCGLRLTSPAPTPAAPPARPQTQVPLAYTPRHLAEKILTLRSALEGERRQITVLFADLSGFTSISEKLDPEEVHALMDQCFKILLDGVHRFEGTVNQFTGDGIMALFGAPLAHEDHAQRAVHAALEMQKAIKAYGKDLNDHKGIDLKMRIGINTGEVVVAAIGDNLRMDYTAQGDTTNLAARLQTMSPPGGILIGEQTYRLVEGDFDFENLGKAQVKGKSKPVHIYQPRAARPHRDCVDIAEAPYLTRFHGRDHELQLLKGILERARRGHGQVVSVVGEAGTGKTRLLHEFKTCPELEGVGCLYAGSTSYGKSVPYFPFLRLLKVICGIEEGDTESQMRERVRAKLTETGLSALEFAHPLFSLLAIEAEEEALPAVEAEEWRQRTVLALQTLILRESGHRSLMIILENLHWTDTASENLLTQLIDNIPAFPVLLLLSYRPEYRLAGADQAHHTRLTLESLSEDECLELVKDLLGSRTVDEEVKALILIRADGNPLYAEELTKNLLEIGALECSEHGYFLKKDFSTAKIPETIQSLIMARLDRLPESEKRIVQAASVIGREFTLSLIKRIIGAGPELAESLRHLQRLGLIYASGLAPAPRYLFKHALIQETAYHSLLTPRRQALHETAGCAIEENYAGRIEEQFELLSHHFTRSGNHEKAIEYLILAGQKAARLFAHEHGIGFFQEALKQIDELSGIQAQVRDRKQVEVLFKLEIELDSLAKREEQGRILERLILVAGRLQDAEILSDAYIRQGEFLSVVGATNDALACVERALTLKKQIGNRRGEAKALRGAAFIHWRRTEYEESLKLHQALLEIDRELGDREAEGSDLTSLGELLRKSHRYQDALRILEEALAILAKGGNLVALTICHHTFGNVYMDLERYEKALEHFHKACEIGRRVSFTISHSARCTPMNIAAAYAKLGRHREALQYHRESIEISRKIGDRAEELATLQRVAVTHKILKEFPQAIASYQEALRLAQDLKKPKEEATILANLGDVHRQDLRNYAAALGFYRQSMTIAAATGTDEGLLSVLKGLGATCWNLGLFDEAEAALERALSRPELSADLAEQAAVRSTLGVVLRSQRRYAAAVAQLEQALRIAQEMADARAQAYILNALGNVYQEAGDLPKAQECYQTAIDHRRRLGDRSGEGWSCYYLGQAHAEAGDLVSARQFAQAALTLVEQTEEKELKTRIEITLSVIHSRIHGREAYEAALQHARKAVELSRANGLAHEELMGLSQQAIAAQLLGNLDEAMSLSEAAVSKLEQAGPAGDRESIWLNHSRILRAAGRDELADGSFDRAYEAMNERLASVRDESFKQSLLNTRIVREIFAGRTKGGKNHATLSN